MLKYIFLLILIRLAHRDYLVSKSPTIVKDHLLAPQELIHDFLLWWSLYDCLFQFMLKKALHFLHFLTAGQEGEREDV